MHKSIYNAVDLTDLLSAEEEGLGAHEILHPGSRSRYPGHQVLHIL